MADYSQYPDSGANFNQYSDWGRILHRGNEAEGMALMNMLHALDTFRPSVVLALARVSTDDAQFDKLMNAAFAARAFPDEAERLASKCAATFDPHDAGKADRAFGIIMFCATGDDDSDWRSVGDITRRIHRNVTAMRGSE